MTEWQTTNLNHMVRVKLTPQGERIYRDYWAPYTHGRDPLADKIVDGWLEEQLWSIAAIFGPHLSIGFDPPIAPDIQVQCAEASD